MTSPITNSTELLIRKLINLDATWKDGSLRIKLKDAVATVREHFAVSSKKPRSENLTAPQVLKSGDSRNSDPLLAACNAFLAETGTWPNEKALQAAIDATNIPSLRRALAVAAIPMTSMVSSGSDKRHTKEIQDAIRVAIAEIEAALGK